MSETTTPLLDKARVGRTQNTSVRNAVIDFMHYPISESQYGNDQRVVYDVLGEIKHALGAHIDPEHEDRRQALLKDPIIVNGMVRLDYLMREISSGAITAKLGTDGDLAPLRERSHVALEPSRFTDNYRIILEAMGRAKKIYLKYSEKRTKDAQTTHWDQLITDMQQISLAYQNTIGTAYENKTRQTAR